MRLTVVFDVLLLTFSSPSHARCQWAVPRVRGCVFVRGGRIAGSRRSDLGVMTSYVVRRFAGLCVATVRSVATPVL